jgi:hypothetical protein
MTTINWLTLFREIIAGFSENDTKPINTFCVKNTVLLEVSASGMYSYQWVLKA